MFDSVQLSHDLVIERAVEAASALEPHRVADAFLASLTNRRLDLRSALGSYAVGRLLQPHAFSGTGACVECGAYETEEPTDLNVLNFERLKWGGVRHTDPAYIALDLELFAKTDIPKPSSEDTRMFLEVLNRASSLPDTSRARDLERAIGGLFRSNKAEREIFLQILGYAGILAPVSTPGFLVEFIPASQRDLPSASKIDWQYPFAWWRGSDGYNRNALTHWFPGLVASAA